jgi:hypothetical protein
MGLLRCVPRNPKPATGISQAPRTPSTPASPRLSLVSCCTSKDRLCLAIQHGTDPAKFANLITELNAFLKRRQTKLKEVMRMAMVTTPSRRVHANDRAHWWTLVCVSPSSWVAF